ncbi:RinA family protein, partial [Weissella paramesenteroides]|uniref:RinA family protein n=1 Tax=Weissella paramesenteroides TaxID=1249 RepID=UPI00223B56DD
MADKIDHLLTDYFTGQLEANIKLRKLELSYHNDHDDNVGGGRMQNNIVRNTETTMLKVESDRLIQNWLYANQVIELMFALELDNVQRIIKARYGQRRTWIDIS